MDLAVGLEGHIGRVKDAVEATVSFETMASQIGPMAEMAGIGGGNWSDLYDVVYRSLSTWGAHPSYWVLHAYLDDEKPYMLHVRPFVPADGRADVLMFDIVHLVAMLGAEVLAKLEIDATRLREVDMTWRAIRAHQRAAKEDRAAEPPA